MKQFFRFLATVLCAFLISLVPFYGVCSYVWLGLPAYYREGYHKGLVKQYRALKRSDETQPKIVAIGDSSMAYGVDSAQLSSLTGMPCYTLGMHGGMGMAYIFELLEPFIHEGDLIVYPCNPYGAIYYGVDLILMSIEKEPDLYFDFVLRHPFLALSRLKDRCFVKCKGLAMNTPYETTDEFYGKDSFDENGNFTVERGDGYWDYFEECEHIEYSPKIYGDTMILHLNAFDSLCKERGATLLLTSPAMYRGVVDNDEASIEAFEGWVRDTFTAPLISDWDEHFYEKEYFFNYVAHCNSAGMKRYTDSLAEDINSYMEEK
ncbi:MAG: hypothetical protein J6D37_05050 [Clostridia bacterium]|nr:hypothetical protein [Clostridia bacterium]